MKQQLDWEKKFDDMWYSLEGETADDGLDYGVSLCEDEKIKKFIHSELKKAKQEGKKEIMKIMKRYIELNTDDMLGTVDVKTFGERMIELLSFLKKWK